MVSLRPPSPSSSQNSTRISCAATGRIPSGFSSTEGKTMKDDFLLTPGTVNTMQLPHRLIMGPMERAMCNIDGTITQRYIDYLVERAKGGAGLIHVEATYVDSRGQGNPYQLGAHGDHTIPGLRRMAEAVHEYGAKVSLQLYFGGRQNNPGATHQQTLAPSAVPCTFLGENPPIPREMTKRDIVEIRDAFTQAAERCISAGIDMVHLHGAHGYLLGQFVSPFSNHRTDEYGGSLENRARFPLEVLRAVRAVTGADYPIGYRLSAVEYVPNGLTLDESAEFATMLAADGIDLIDVSAAVYESFSRMFHGPESPRGGYVSYAAEIKKRVGDTPVSVTQRLNDPAFAEQAAKSANLDFISLTRAFHADPRYIRKLREDRANEILPCIGCHACLNRLFSWQPPGCATNPHSSFERTRDIRPTNRPQNVLVIGGGPGGMHAARILARQGNRVTLYERSDRLGGQVNYSSRIAPDYADLITWLTDQLERLQVDVRLGVEVTAQDVRESAADAIVVATGARGDVLRAPAVNPPPMFDLYSAFERDEDEWDGTVVLVGGDAESCALALWLAGLGTDVYIVEAGGELSPDKEAPARTLLLETLVALPTVHVLTNTTVEMVDGQRVRIQTFGTESTIDEVQTVVVGGRVPEHALYDELAATDEIGKVHRLGDAVRVRDIYSASSEAAEVAQQVRTDAIEKVFLAPSV
ncbi:MAG: FAD-dependent oxidoreductase [Beutenbergiaceae bacterium]